ncbi:MAG: cysteine-S-conjugate beta-lyase [Gaiellaceae bacterium]|nr:cysteine-S-conjugate beta-lyase [Gaiellaceae bacterium]
MVPDVDLSRIDQTPVEELRAAGSVKWTAHPDALGLFVAEMDFGLAPAVAEALHAAVDGGRTGYLPSALTQDLAAATAAWCADRYGWAVPAERVHAMGDVLAGLEVAIRHFSTPDSAVIVPTPAYMPFLWLPRALGRQIVEVPSPAVDGRYELDLDGIARAFEAGANLLVLCNPWNPVGRVLERDELLAVAEVVDHYGGRVFADEIHAPLTFEKPHLPYAAVSETAAAHTVTATSASKAFNLPGLKCAQLILSNEADEARFAEDGGFVAHGASSLGVIANTAAYTGGGPWLDEVLGYLDGNRRALGSLLDEHLPEVGYRMPEGTYIGWLDARELGIEGSPADFFLEHAGVALTDGTACGTPGFLRFVFATPRPVVQQAIERMACALR